MNDTIASRIVLFLALMPAAGCLPLYLPPGRAEVSLGARAVTFRDPRLNDDSPAPAPAPGVGRPIKPGAPESAGAAVLRASVGIHLASAFLPDKAPPFDVGLGYVFTDLGWDDRFVHGGYIEATPVLYRNTYLRVLAGGRGELLFPDKQADGLGWSALGRALVEVISPVHGAGVERARRGFTAGAGYGTFGLGIFAEAGVQHLPAGEEAVMAVGGLSLRFPTAFGIVCCSLPKRGR